MNQEDMYDILKWDSTFFGIKVVKILVPAVNISELERLLKNLTKIGVKLVYYFSDNEIQPSILPFFNGLLVDKKMTYQIDLKHTQVKKLSGTNIVKCYTSSILTSDLQNLAIQSGKYSRFSVDTHIQQDVFERLYLAWINAILMDDKKEVFIIKDMHKIVGMITTSIDEGHGTIGLLAIDPDYRQKQYGYFLVNRALLHFIENDCTEATVITQVNNIPANSLYKKSHFHLEKSQYIYHFWL